jgi:hypothetical protein
VSQSFWSTLGRPGSVTEFLAARQKAAADAALRAQQLQQEDKAQLSRAQISGIAVGSAVAAVLLSGLVSLLFVRHRRRIAHRSLFGRVLAPGEGLDTTLVITDVQVKASVMEVLAVYLAGRNTHSMV